MNGRFSARLFRIFSFQAWRRPKWAFKDCNAHDRLRLRFSEAGAATANRCAPRFPKPGSDAVFAVAAVSGIPSHIPSSPQALAQRVRTRVAAGPHFLQFGSVKKRAGRKGRRTEMGNSKSRIGISSWKMRQFAPLFIA